MSTIDMPDVVLRDLLNTIGRIKKHDHLCLIYKTQEEQFSTVIPFIKIGLERGEKCIYVTDENTAATVIDSMKAMDIPVEEAIELGKLTIISKQESYLKQGYFDPDWMIKFLKDATDDAIEKGFSALRVTGEMTWVLSGDPGTERLMEYEAKLNYFFPENDALAICQYNLNRFSPEIIQGVISTHPLIIFGGMVCKNFYYVPPDDFLETKQSSKEIERTLTNIKNREKVEEELRLYQERLEELVKQRTTELSRMNERFSLATHAAHLGVWDWDLQKNELIWDDRMYELYGVKREDFAGAYEAWLNGVHPDDRAASDEISKQAQRGEREYDTEFRVVWPDGSIRYLKAHGQFVRDANGKPIRMTGINYDITNGKLAEGALFEAQQLFRTLVENSPDIIARYDLNCRRTYVNPAYLKTAQFSRKELVDSSPVEFSPLPASSAVIVQDMLRKVLDSGEAEAVDVIWPKADNIDYWYNIYASPEFDRDGKVVSVMTVSRDITERKRAEEAIAIKQYQLIEAQKLAGIGSYELDLNDGYWEGSDEFLRMFGFNEAKRYSQLEFQKIVHPDDLKWVMDFFAECLASGKRFDCEYRTINQLTGKVLWVRSTSKIIRNDLGVPQKILGSKQDITERKLAEEEIHKLNRELEQRVKERTARLEAANKELENFAYSIAHDLRSPLRGIDGFSQLLLDAYHDKVDALGKNYLHRVRSAAQYMAQLIDDLLELTRINRSEINSQIVNLSELAKEIAENLRGTQPERRVEFIVQDGITVEGDNRLLGIVLENLIENAWKFTSKHKTAVIEFGRQQQNNTMVYFVKDDGVGFDMNYSQKLFGVFQRLHATSEFAGTGIGLATVQRIIQRHGGSVWAEGEVEKGATFYFTIP